jgi:hypothetical protein
MKKLFLYLSVIILISLGCENDIGIDPSEITYFPKMEMKGKSVINLECNATSFADPGVTALEGGNSVEVKVITHGRYFGSNSVNGPDVYDINYTAINVDGIPGSVLRTVYVPPCNGNFVNSIEGVYESTVVRNGVVSPQYQGLKYVYVKKVGNNVYQLSDAIGGYYDFGRGYGSDYAFVGLTVTANNLAANDFTYGPTVQGGAFGGDCDLTAFSVVPATKTINFETKWLTYKFVVTLTQVQ